jgi:SAM-dependent methyltransferase
VRATAVDLRSCSLPYQDAEFDVVVMCEVLEHLNFNPLPLLKEINRVLKLGGGFYLAVPNIARIRNRARLLLGKSIHPSIDHFFWELDRTKNMVGGIHWREYSRDELRKLLEPMGFRVEQQYFFSTIPRRQPRWLRAWKHFLFACFPGWKNNITTIASKQKNAEMAFHFWESSGQGSKGQSDGTVA